MGFGKDLAKGFIRSAVNQVGRDGGKVVSNNIYGNKHSTPVNVNGKESLYVRDKSSSVTVKNEDLFTKFFGAVLLSLFVPVLGTIIVFFRGVVNWNRDYVIGYETKTQSVYKSDKRYSSGNRYEGSRQVQVSIKLEASEDDLKKNKLKAKGYFVISIAFIIFFILFYILAPKKQ